MLDPLATASGSALTRRDELHSCYASDLQLTAQSRHPTMR